MAVLDVTQLQVDVLGRLEGLDRGAYLGAMAIILRDAQSMHVNDQSQALAALIDEAIGVLTCRSGPGCTITDADINRLLDDLQMRADDEGSAGSTGLVEELETVSGVLSELLGLAPAYYGAQTVTLIAYETFTPPAPSGISLSDPDEQLEETHPIVVKLRQYLEVVAEIEASSADSQAYDADQIYATVFRPSR